MFYPFILHYLNSYILIADLLFLFKAQLKRQIMESSDFRDDRDTVEENDARSLPFNEVSKNREEAKKEQTLKGKLYLYSPYLLMIKK